MEKDNKKEKISKKKKKKKPFRLALHFAESTDLFLHRLQQGNVASRANDKKSNTQQNEKKVEKKTETET